MQMNFMVNLKISISAALINPAEAPPKLMFEIYLCTLQLHDAVILGSFAFLDLGLDPLRRKVKIFTMRLWAILYAM